MNLTALWSAFATWFTGKQSAPNLEQAGQAAIAEAVRLWQSDIFDPRKGDTSIAAMASRKAIEDMIRSCGWLWELPYEGDGSMEWCGMFAGACWIKAGLRPDLAKTYFASTYRLDRFARYLSVSGEKNPKPAGEPRLMAELDEHSTYLPFEPRAGDILTIGPAGSGYGKHICLVRSYDADKRWFKTTEGNGVGIGPNGARRQGVVTGVRVLGGPTWHARRLIRPSPHDLT